MIRKETLSLHFNCNLSSPFPLLVILMTQFHCNIRDWTLCSVCIEFICTVCLSVAAWLRKVDHMRLPVLMLHHLKVNTVAVSVKYYTLAVYGLFILFCFDGTVHLEFIISPAAGRQVPGTPSRSSVNCSRVQTIKYITWAEDIKSTRCVNCSQGKKK